MSNLAFPNGTWSFLLLPTDLRAAKNQFQQVSGRVTFQTVGIEQRMILTVEKKSASAVVAYQSNSPIRGEITSNPTFKLGEHTYQFMDPILIRSFPLIANFHEAASCQRVSVNGSSAAFVALEENSQLLQPKPGDYLVTDALNMQYCTLTVSDARELKVTPLQGHAVNQDAEWNPPTAAWPPTISWVVNDLRLPDTVTFQGVMTMAFEFEVPKVFWAFGGTLQRGSVGNDDDWTSQSHSEPTEGKQVMGGYA